MSNLQRNITLPCFFQQDNPIYDPTGPTVESGCTDGDAAVKDSTDNNLELARQLDFDSESLPLSDQQGETDSSHLHGNGGGEIQISRTDESAGDPCYSGQEDESGSDDLSQVINGSSCPTPTTQHKVRPNTL